MDGESFLIITNIIESEQSDLPICSSGVEVNNRQQEQCVEFLALL